MFRNNQISPITLRVRAFMRALFGVFLFIYFYFLQSPLLSLAQLQLSEGKTIYYPLVSAVILTGLLLLVQKLVVKWIDFTESLYVFSYVPAVVLAVLTTAFTPTVKTSVLLFCAVAIVGFLLASVISAKLNSRDAREISVPRLLATHLFGLVCVFLSLGAFSHSNDVTTYEIKCAQSIRQMNYEQALHIGETSLATSPRLSALRAYALAHTEGGVGSGYFSYPLAETGAEQILFAAADTLAQMLPPDSLYAALGVWRSEKETALQFLDRARKNNTSRMAQDYWLVGLLLDKDLERFAHELPRIYLPGDSCGLPKHYEEALILRADRNQTALSVQVDTLCMQAYHDYQIMAAEYPDTLQRRNQMWRYFGHTYWWYYDYQR